MLGQVMIRRSVDDFAEAVEAGAVAGAIPSLLGVVPVDDAAEVGADGGTLVNGSGRVAVSGDFGEAASENGARVGTDVVDGADVAAGEPVGVLAGDVEVLFGELAKGTKVFARGVVKMGPRVLAAERSVSGRKCGRPSRILWEFCFPY